MIRGRELYGIIEQAVDREEVDGAIVVTTKGSILTTAGFEEPKVVSAISANIWSHFRVVGDLGDLETVVFDAEQGVLAVGGLPEYLVGLYSKKRAQPGLLLARLEALRSQLVAYTSLTPTDDVVAAVRDFESALEASVAMEPVAELALSKLGHSLAAGVLERAAEKGGHWSLLSRLSQAFSRVRRSNSESIGAFLAASGNASDDDPERAEARLVETWRSRVGEEYSSRAEREFLDGLRWGALREANARVAAALVERAMNATTRLPSTNATLEAAAEAAGKEVRSALEDKWGTGEAARNVSAAGAELALARYSVRNDVAASKLANGALARADRELAECLEQVPTEAKMGLGHDGAARVCEAEASMRWTEVEDSSGEVLRPWRERRRAEASRRLRFFRNRAAAVRGDLDAALNLTDESLRSVFDAPRILPVDDVGSGAAKARLVVDRAASRGAEMAAARLKEEEEALVVVAAAAKARASFLYEKIDAWLDELNAANARASSRCARDSLEEFVVSNSAAAERGIFELVAMAPPEPRQCQGPLKNELKAELEAARAQFEAAKRSAKTAVRTLTGGLALFAVVLALLLFRSSSSSRRKKCVAGAIGGATATTLAAGLLLVYCDSAGPRLVLAALGAALALGFFSACGRRCRRSRPKYDDHVL
ncbi:hypothetical protein CTAYLR_001892 [Chrysophaeum taylorii]|uniref:Roadblock/LAMTOR2 domain-containing protein n=1 Tax=Chrysophaeum taylorii TaxID=2483200 RepID=A0AAD7U870_9STRA|nr:hypothetical protein CTAYLR_001892 [Chrysophaeum taylorii]